MHFDFSGYDGYKIYSPPYGSGEKESFDGKVIDYTQDWLTINPGVALGYYFLRYFYTELFFQISPFVFCRDLDQHLMTDTQYKDYMRGGLLTEPGLRFSFFAGKWFELSLDFSWRHIGGTKGKTWQGTIGSADFEQGGDAGAGLSFTDTSFSFKIRL
jgi:outer membrane protease